MIVIPNKGWLSTINMGLSTENEFSDREDWYLFPLIYMLFDEKIRDFRYPRYPQEGEITVPSGIKVLLGMTTIPSRMDQS